MHKETRYGPRGRAGSLTTVLVVALALAGCRGSEDTSARVPAALNVNTPAEIAQASAADYDDNVNGLITGNTLKGWLDDWEGNRPAGVTGRLIILQANAGAAGYEFIKPVPQQVFTYQVNVNSELMQTRSNGVVSTVSMVADGPTVDAFLEKYDIDPSRDLIVCGMGTGSTGVAMQQGRCWYTLRYWGVDRKNLAILNGDNKWQFDSGQLDASYFSTTASTPPGTGRASVRDLPADNTALQATVQDMIQAIGSGGTRKDGVLIWDARHIGQYSAGEMAESGCAGGEPRCAADPAAYMNTFQNGGSRQGHPRSTLQLQFTHLLDGTKGWSYKPKAELQAYLDGDADGNGHTFVDGTYQPVGAGNVYRPGDTVYVYCETTMRAMITGVASAVILGLPTRFYDGAMTEWNSLSNITTRQGTPILPEDSPWRTDLPDLSFFKAADSAEKIAPRPVDDAYALNTNAVIEADRAYKFGTQGGDSSDGSGGGIAPPPNPCGG